MKNLDKLIEEKTKELNLLTSQIRELGQKLAELNALALKLDGAISQLKELKKIEAAEKK